MNTQYYYTETSCYVGFMVNGLLESAFQ